LRLAALRCGKPWLTGEDWFKDFLEASPPARGRASLKNEPGSGRWGKPHRTGGAASRDQGDARRSKAGPREHQPIPRTHCASPN